MQDKDISIDAANTTAIHTLKAALTTALAAHARSLETTHPKRFQRQQAMGVNANTLTAIERGAGSISIEMMICTLVRCGIAFNVTVDATGRTEVVFPMPREEPLGL
jgi:hypothetical protein